MCVYIADNTISRILDDVLSLQKIEDGAFELHFVHFALQSLVDNVIRSFSAAAAAKGIALQLQADSLDDGPFDIALVGPPRVMANDTPSPESSDSLIESKAETALPVRSTTTQRPSQRLLEGDLYRLQQVVANFVSNGTNICCCSRVFDVSEWSS